MTSLLKITGLGFLIKKKLKTQVLYMEKVQKTTNNDNHKHKYQGRMTYVVIQAESAKPRHPNSKPTEGSACSAS